MPVLPKEEGGVDGKDAGTEKATGLGRACPDPACAGPCVWGVFVELTPLVGVPPPLAAPLALLPRCAEPPREPFFGFRPLPTVCQSVYSSVCEVCIVEYSMYRRGSREQVGIYRVRGGSLLAVWCLFLGLW